MEKIKNPQFLCGSMTDNIRIDQIKKQISRCPKQSFAKGEAQYPASKLREEKSNIFFTKNFIDAFEDMKQNKKPKMCRLCNPFYSQTHNKWFEKDWNVGEIENLQLSDFIPDICDFIFSPVCNMTCMYCDAGHSNQWGNLLGKQYIEDDDWDRAAEDCLVDYIQKYIHNKKRKFRIQILGGEPLLHWPKLRSFLDTHVPIFKDSNTIYQIAITSNLNVLEKNIINFIDYTNKHSHVDWQVSSSIDSVGKRAEDIRTGLDFNLFVKNLHKLAENSHIKLGVLAAVNMLSISSLEEHYKYWISISKQYNRTIGVDWAFGDNMVTWPVSMSPTLLPDTYKVYVKNIKPLIQKEFPEGLHKKQVLKKLDTIENSINTARTKENLEEAKKFYLEQGKLKDINYFRLFPELHDILR